MSQEEEKLIEELTSIVKLNFSGLKGETFGMSVTEAQILSIVIPLIKKAYHSGKLAGIREKLNKETYE